tara:strand:+ start:40 stop:261 length:222 start_codon:yes stop_codon:yes gene_type:complete
MTNREIIEKIRDMLETNTMVNWDHADYTPAEEFQNMIDELDKMVADQKTSEYNKGWNDALRKAQKIVGANKND